MKIGAIIQARVSSTRLPKKVLLNLPYESEITVLQQVIRRVFKSNKISDVVVATTTDYDDNVIVEYAEKENAKWFRGSKEDLLSRYYLAAKENKLDVIVRITSDCPCIDWEIIDLVIEHHISEKSDYTSNTLKRTFPHGLDVEVLSFESLEKAYINAKESFEREHVCPYIYTTHKDEFKVCSVESSQHLSGDDIRITLDTEEDYALLCAVYDYLFFHNEYFKAIDIIKLFKQKPWLKLINKKVVQKKTFTNLNDEISEAIKVLKLQDLYNSANMLENIIKKEQ
ncbi:cytidylyltransferase domain-containing protein [Calditerrivibrio nitroreducens]|uniref:Acylneuraminate cytidylyltransferase n=1 Tax=Calditerrivibrio nitroreducens (strain DSM 19672 / NBRC 101217 / Yu37-1) TaxID=768670 RepID=E4TGE1_CALNY|nr:glycosyltransferase family protein [Calditerrivibrio nitroreducens]ADR18622.1 acylneuraminate cytidylyltransferase [Calditerrivibrio nitroreducens DSM 19672]